MKKQQESLRQKLEADQARRKAQAERQEVKAEQKAQEQLKRAQHPPVPEKKVSKIDKLRLKLEKAEAKAAAKASKSKAAAGNSDGPASDPTQAGAEASSETASAEVDLSEESSVLSSSGDDTTDSDAESGSGIPASPPPKASKPEPIDGRKAPNKLCHAFAAKGHCPRGRRCPYKHERQPKHPQSRARKPFEPLKRKSLFQRFVEQEEAAEKHKPARSDRMPDQQP